MPPEVYCQDVASVGGTVESAVEGPHLRHTATPRLGCAEEAHGVATEPQWVAGESHGSRLCSGEELPEVASPRARAAGKAAHHLGESEVVELPHEVYVPAARVGEGIDEESAQVDVLHPHTAGAETVFGYDALHCATGDEEFFEEACVELGFLTAERFDEVFHPENMV